MAKQASRRVERPRSGPEAAEVMGAAASDRRSVRPRGGGTKLGWGHPGPQPDLEISTERLDRIVEHNAPDLTAVLEAGVPLASARAAFAEAGQMLALDPPLGPGGAATIGGIVAAGDTGPLRHRYGGPRDLLLGMTVVLSDGTVARSGGKVIKNVAGYDLAKLFAGSFGTLGLVLEVAVRLHPLPPRRVTALGVAEDPESAQSAALALARAPLELESLDITWDGGRGQVLARCAGAAPEARADEAVRLLSGAGLAAEVVHDDEELWERQRAGQRSAGSAVVRVSGLPARLAEVLWAAERSGASVVGRAGMGLSWVALPPGPPEKQVGAIEELRRDLHPFPCVVLDAPREVRETVDVWGDPSGAALALLRRVKAGFDPAGICNPGVFVGGI